MLDCNSSNMYMYCIVMSLRTTSCYACEGSEKAMSAGQEEVSKFPVSCTQTARHVFLMLPMGLLHVTGLCSSYVCVGNTSFAQLSKARILSVCIYSSQTNADWHCYLGQAQALAVLPSCLHQVPKKQTLQCFGYDA